MNDAVILTLEEIVNKSESKKTTDIILLSFFCITLIFSTSSADWPSESFEGIRLFNTPDLHDSRVASFLAENNTMYVVAAVHEGPEFHLRLQGITQEGNLQWPDSTSGIEIYPITVDITGNWFIDKAVDHSIWMGSQDFTMAARDEYGDPINCTLMLSRVSAAGEASDLTILDDVYGEVQQIKHFKGMFPQPDSSMIVVWYVVTFDHPERSGVFAQRFSSDCEPMWPEDETLLARDYCSNFVDDGAHGALMTLGEDAMRLLPNGEFAWLEGSVPIINPGAFVLTQIGLGRALGIWHHSNLENNIVTGFDSSGTLIWGEGIELPFSAFFGDDEQSYGNLFPIGENFLGILCNVREQGNWQTNYVLLDQDLNYVFPDTLLVLNPESGNYNFVGNSIGFSCQLNTTTIEGYSTYGELQWQQQFTEWGSQYFDTEIHLDDQGNTWVVWTDLTEENTNTMINVISPQGIWGTYSTNIIAEPTIETPSDFVVETWPNPFNSMLNLQVQLQRPGSLDLEVYNILSQQVYRSHHPQLTAGSHSLYWDAAKLASGFYVVRLVLNNTQTRTREVILLK